MKRNFVVLFTLIVVSLLIACNSLQDDSIDDPMSEKTFVESIRETDSKVDEVTHKGPIVKANLTESFEKTTFIGIIEEINGNMAIVLIEEGDILRSGNMVGVDLSVAKDITFEINDKIKVGFDGIIREKFPLGINTTFVELIE